MNKPVKFLIIGRTAAGKTEIAKAVAKELGLSIVKSYTDRPKRPSEEAESDHTHVSVPEMDDILKSENDPVVAFTEINGTRYCATLNQLKENDIYVIDPMGWARLVDQYEDEFRFVLIYICTRETDRLKYWKARAGLVADFFDRSVSEDSMFKVFEKCASDYWSVFNLTSFENAVKQTINIIEEEISR